MRTDGRKPDELRELVIKAGILKRADGSAYVKMGNTVVIAAVYGPRGLFPKHLQDSNQAYIRCRYNMAPFSTKDRKRPGHDRRSTEISKVIADALHPAVFVNEFPRAGIDIFIEILQGDAGTRCAGINAASVALADAGVPMRDLICAVAGGKVDNECVIDLTYDEEEVTACDLPVAYMPNLKQITLLQMDGDVSSDDIKGILSMNIGACQKIYEAQVSALKKKYVEKE